MECCNSCLIFSSLEYNNKKLKFLVPFLLVDIFNNNISKVQEIANKSKHLIIL